MNIKRSVLCLISVIIVVNLIPVWSFASEFRVGDDVPSIIIMDNATGTVIYEKDADSPRPPASVTKVMTMLLIMEYIDGGKLSYDDVVTVSANAASMGGSQVYLKEGEQMTVRDMLKSITVASANDACVAMAEHIVGSESAFVDMMNERAAQLGMANTHFENTNGLDDTAAEHYTSARDIAIMSRELLKHKDILEFSSIWMDTIRGGEFGLTNTNKLIRFYKGANGLKTGSTSKAGFCISATAERDGMTLICVIMGAPTKDVRNETAKQAFDFGFANYSVFSDPGYTNDEFPVVRGTSPTCNVASGGFEILAEKGKKDSITKQAVVPESVAAPVKAGDVIGKVVYSCGDEVVGESEITVKEDVPEIGYFGVLFKLIKNMITV